MIAATLDEREHLAALKALVVAQPQTFPVHGFDDVPGTYANGGDLPPVWASLGVERRYVEVERSAGGTSRSGWRVSARGLGRDEDECRLVMFTVSRAFEQQLVTVDGASGLLRFESSTNPRYDDGRFWADAFWTYAL